MAVSIPNSDVTASAVNNYSREDLRRVDRTFCTSYENTTDEVKAAIAEAIGKDARILSEPAPFVRLLDYKGSTVEYVVRVWCKGSDYWDVYFDLNEAHRRKVKKRHYHYIMRTGNGFPFPACLFSAKFFKKPKTADVAASSANSEMCHFIFFRSAHTCFVRNLRAEGE